MTGSTSDSAWGRLARFCVWVICIALIQKLLLIHASAALAGAAFRLSGVLVSGTGSAKAALLAGAQPNNNTGLGIV